MNDTDMELYLEYFDIAKLSKGAPRAPIIKILSDPCGLFVSEIWRLSRSIRIASFAGIASSEAADSADHIWQELQQSRCRPLSDKSAWVDAIAWAIARGASPFSSGNAYARQQQVGLGFARLRSQGFDLTIGSYGIDIPSKSRESLFQKVDTLIAKIGGTEVILRICKVFRQSNKIHDGMWILGDEIPNFYAVKKPSPPIGWLLALSCRHLAMPIMSYNPHYVWKELIEISTDIAACLDCQRYSQFEGMNMHPSEFHRSIAESLFFREFFTASQVPSIVIDNLKDVLPEVLAEIGDDAQSKLIRSILGELSSLNECTSADRPTFHKLKRVTKLFPNLFAIGTGKRGLVNSKFSDIFIAEFRNDDRQVFFECSDSKLMTMPRPMMNAAGCDIVFSYIWKTFDRKTAEKIVGIVMERALAKACLGKSTILFAHKKYYVNNTEYDMDVASRDEDEIVLMETKAKSLTARSRQLGGFSYISDLNQSYFKMMKQLMTHEKHIRAGSNPLTSPNELAENLRPLKVAVSPLSYGQISDKNLASALIRSLLNVTLNVLPSQDSSENRTIISDLNKAIAKLKDLMIELSPKSNGIAEVTPYLIDFFWLDLGQTLYVLDRASSVSDAFRPLKHITFSSRDFWTEIAITDRGGYTRGKWRSVS